MNPFRWLLFGVFELGKFLLLGLVCLHINATAIAHLLPDFGTPLWKSGLPGLSALKGYEGWHKVTFAHIGAFLVYLAVSYLWPHVLAVFLTPARQEREGWHLANTSRFLLYQGLAVLGADAVLFWVGSFRGGWGASSARAFPATVITVLYVALLMSASYVALKILHKNPKGWDR